MWSYLWRWDSIDFGQAVGQIFEIWPVNKAIDELNLKFIYLSLYIVTIFILPYSLLF